MCHLSASTSLLCASTSNLIAVQGNYLEVGRLISHGAAVDPLRLPYDYYNSHRACPSSARLAPPPALRRCQRPNLRSVHRPPPLRACGVPSSAQRQPQDAYP